MFLLRIDFLIKASKWYSNLLVCHSELDALATWKRTSLEIHDENTMNDPHNAMYSSKMMPRLFGIFVEYKNLMNKLRNDMRYVHTHTHTHCVAIANSESRLIGLFSSRIKLPVR